MKNFTYGYDFPDSGSSIPSPAHSGGDNIFCQTLTAAQRVVTGQLQLGGHYLSIVDGVLTGMDFNGDKVTTQTLTLDGEQFDPDDYEKKGEGWQLALVSEVGDEVRIDGNLKVGAVLLTPSASDLVISKRIVVPDATIGGAKFDDHFSLSETYTHILKNVTVSSNHFFSIGGWSFTRQGDTLKLDAPDGLWSRVFETREGTLGSEDVTTHFSSASVIGGGIGDAYTDKQEPKPVALTISGDDLSKFQLAVRGKIIAHQVNSGISSFTLYHHVQLEGDLVLTGLEGRLFSWTGIPRMAHPETGVEVNDWKSLDHQHALSSVTLTTEKSSRRVCGSLHSVCAEKDATEFRIKTPHGETVHAYHGARPMIQCAAKGDSLLWVVPGTWEIDHEMLSGSWEKFSNGVSQGNVQMVVNQDFSFAVQDLAGLHNRIQVLEQKLSILLNL